MKGMTEAALPDRTLRSWMASNRPTPLAPTTSAAVIAGTYWASLASDVPPGLVARKTTSSCLKSVGFSTTRTPFYSFHSVTLKASVLVLSTTAPDFGGVSMSAVAPPASA